MSVKSNMDINQHMIRMVEGTWYYYVDTWYIYRLYFSISLFKNLNLLIIHLIRESASLTLMIFSLSQVKIKVQKKEGWNLGVGKQKIQMLIYHDFK